MKLKDEEEEIAICLYKIALHPGVTFFGEVDNVVKLAVRKLDMRYIFPFHKADVMVIRNFESVCSVTISNPTHETLLKALDELADKLYKTEE